MSDESRAETRELALGSEEGLTPQREGPRAATGSAAEPHPIVYNHYGPHRNGLPPMRKYIRELWQRREFAIELSRSNMRASSSDTFFGQLWLVLNPLLMAGVYFLLVAILTSRASANPNYFAHLTTNLFVFTFVVTCANAGATSVTTAGKMILNTAFPRLLIPLGAVHTAFFRFIPTIIVTIVIFVVTSLLGGDIGWGPQQLLALYFLLMMLLFGAGLAALFSTMQVYFRDTNNFLPYFVRIWTYLSPILWTVEMVEGRAGGLHTWAQLNPAYHLLGGYSGLLMNGEIPLLGTWLIAAAWGVGTFAVGALLFMTREREFAVRIF